MVSDLLWVNGRNGRGKYWLISLSQFAIFLILCWDFIAATMAENEAAMAEALTSPVNLIAFVVLFWTGLVNAIRRYHDRGKSGWWFLIQFIPIVGPIWQFIELGFCSGDDGDNNWGPPPGAARAQEDYDREIEGLKQSGRGLAKIDDNYFENHAAEASKRAEPVVQTTYDRPAYNSGSSSGAPVFGRR